MEVFVARSPLFQSLRRAFRIATIAARNDGRMPPVDELLDIAYSRRRFLKDSALATAALTGTSLLSACGGTTPAGNSPTAGGAGELQGGNSRIVIVGGGMAGLNTAYQLQKVGLKATIYEGSDRTGGRMFTAKDLLGDGITTELGGEFIDSTHEEMLRLIDEFGFQRIDTAGPEAESLIKETYFVNGRHYTQAQAAKAFVPLAKRILEDYDSLGDVVSHKEEGGGTMLDRMPMSAYFDTIGAKGWLREVLDAAYVTEYGLDAAEQSALNFIFLIGTGDLENAEVVDLLGESDERYKVRGGNETLVAELARRLEGQIERQHRLTAMRSKGEGFTLTFQVNGAAKDVDADIVVLAIPFTMLREVDMQVELPPVKKTAIQELGYGTNAKILVGFKTRQWQKLGYSGAIYTDEPFQLAWDNSFLQPGTAGGLTLYSGGRPGLEVGKGTAEEVANRLMAGVERAYPGCSKERNGKVSRFHWPTFAWTKASYACYKPGQWTTIAGAEELAVGNLFFAGEHCSYDFQGYMNGAAQSGMDAAKAVMAKLSGTPAARLLFEGTRRMAARAGA